MIKVLILTDDVEGWVVKVTHCLNNYRARTSMDEVWIQTDLFYIVIKKHFSESSRGQCLSCAILDKLIPHEIEYEVLHPCVKGSIQRTKTYYKEYEEAMNNGSH